MTKPSGWVTSITGDPKPVTPYGLFYLQHATAMLDGKFTSNESPTIEITCNMQHSACSEATAPQGDCYSHASLRFPCCHTNIECSRDEMF
eukprot:CAMPEP_0184316068 /NCGR_PEP_ID=MMETSP1049-20130417/87752_1 /TAXON_ID=77928 /ORGANISM="Proteomonas sulcata, Strain CCMP704" /LENGTH=89 /DNA_ID=CAMNT_0026634881 /DNA_START=103 /DNA_END=372 /DNA_ORIENTATION=-